LVLGGNDGGMAAVVRGFEVNAARPALANDESAFLAKTIFQGAAAQPAGHHFIAIQQGQGTALAVHPCGHLGKHCQCANATGGDEAFGHAKQTADACAG